jgi:hypothetical protein
MAGAGSRHKRIAIGSLNAFSNYSQFSYPYLLPASRIMSGKI